MLTAEKGGKKEKKKKRLLNINFILAYQEKANKHANRKKMALSLDNKGPFCTHYHQAIRKQSE